MSSTPRTASAGNVNRLMPKLMELLEREDYAEAHRVLMSLLALNPRDSDLLDVQAFLEKAAPPAPEEAVRVFVGRGSFVNTVTFTRSSSHALSGSGGDIGPNGFADGTDCSVRAWDVNTGEGLRCCEGHSSVVN